MASTIRSHETWKCLQTAGQEAGASRSVGRGQQGPPYRLWAEEALDSSASGRPRGCEVTRARSGRESEGTGRGLRNKTKPGQLNPALGGRRRHRRGGADEAAGGRRGATGGSRGPGRGKAPPRPARRLALPSSAPARSRRAPARPRGGRRAGARRLRREAALGPCPPATAAPPRWLPPPPSRREHRFPPAARCCLLLLLRSVLPAAREGKAPSLLPPPRGVPVGGCVPPSPCARLPTAAAAAPLSPATMARGR